MVIMNSRYEVSHQCSGDTLTCGMNDCSSYAWATARDANQANAKAEALAEAEAKAWEGFRAVSAKDCEKKCVDLEIQPGDNVGPAVADPPRQIPNSQDWSVRAECPYTLRIKCQPLDS